MNFSQNNNSLVKNSVNNYNNNQRSNNADFVTSQSPTSIDIVNTITTTIPNATTNTMNESITTTNTIPNTNSLVLLETSLDWCHDHDLDNLLVDQQKDTTRNIDGNSSSELEFLTNNSSSFCSIENLRYRNETIASLTGSILQQFDKSPSSISSLSLCNTSSSSFLISNPLFPSQHGELNITKDKGQEENNTAMQSYICNQSLTQFSTDSLDKLQSLYSKNNATGYKLTFPNAEDGDFDADDDIGDNLGELPPALPTTITNYPASIDTQSKPPITSNQHLLSKCEKNQLNKTVTPSVGNNQPQITSGGDGTKPYLAHDILETHQNNSKANDYNPGVKNQPTNNNGSSESSSSGKDELIQITRRKQQQPNTRSPRFTNDNAQTTFINARRKHRPLSCNDLERLRSQISDFDSLAILLPKEYQQMFAAHGKQQTGQGFSSVNAKLSTKSKRLSLQEGKISEDLVNEIDKNLKDFDMEFGNNFKTADKPKKKLTIFEDSSNPKANIYNNAMDTNNTLHRLISPLTTTINTILSISNPPSTITNSTRIYTVHIQKELIPFLYTLLSDGLKPILKTLFGPIDNTVWKLIESSINYGVVSTERLNELILCINGEEDFCVEGPLKFSAFISGLLNLHLLPSWLTFLRTKERLLHTHYTTQAFLYQSNTKARIEYENLLTYILQLQRRFNFELDIFWETKSLVRKLQDEEERAAEVRRKNKKKSTTAGFVGIPPGVGGTVVRPSTLPTTGIASNTFDKKKRGKSAGGSGHPGKYSTTPPQPKSNYQTPTGSRGHTPTRSSSNRVNTTPTRNPIHVTTPTKRIGDHYPQRKATTPTRPTSGYYVASPTATLGRHDTSSTSTESYQGRPKITKQKSTKTTNEQGFLMKRSYSDERPFTRQQPTQQITTPTTQHGTLLGNHQQQQPTQLTKYNHLNNSEEILEKGMLETQIEDKFKKLRLQWEVNSSHRIQGFGGTSGTSTNSTFQQSSNKSKIPILKGK